MPEACSSGASQTARNGSRSLVRPGERIMTRFIHSLFFFVLLWPPTLQAQTRITTPKEQFGFNIGDDYVLVDYTQYVDYLKKLDRESDRLTVQEMGRSSEGRPMYLAIITSPENHSSVVTAA